MLECVLVGSNLAPHAVAEALARAPLASANQAGIHGSYIGTCKQINKTIMKEFSHTDQEGKARMVDIGNKPEQKRRARARGFIYLQGNTLQLIRDNEIKKGDVLTISEVAGIQAAKRTGELIPLCHPIPLTNVHVKAYIKEEGVEVESEVTCTGRTGVEMEALTAVSTALLTIYDMCKAVDKDMRIGDIRLTEKKKEDI